MKHTFQLQLQYFFYHCITFLTLRRLYVCYIFSNISSKSIFSTAFCAELKTTHSLTHQHLRYFQPESVQHIFENKSLKKIAQKSNIFVCLKEIHTTYKKNLLYP